VNGRQTGTLISWRGDKGFGWASVDDGGPDAFVHVSECPGVAPAVGERLAFDLTITDRGPRAVAVEVLADTRGQ
jgi:CspA family cold shock protein